MAAPFERLRTPRWAVSAAAAVVYVLVAMGLPPSTAQAAENPLASGITTLHLAPPFAKALKKAKVKMTALAPATVRGAIITLPVSGGTLDSDSGRGAVSHSGQLKLKAPRGGLTMRDFTLKTTSMPLIANVSGAQLKLVSGSGFSTAPEGFGTSVRYRTLRLSKNLAERLDKKLKLKKTFSTGEAFGSSLTTTQPSTVIVQAKGDISFEFNPETFAKLSSRDVAINPVFPAEHIANTYVLPIHAGHIAPDASQGVIETQGDIELIKLGSGTVQLRELWPEFGPDVIGAELVIEPGSTVTGGLARQSIAAFGLSGATLASDPATRTIGLSSLAVNFAAVTAATFNQAFAKGEGEVFKAGEPLGTISFRVTAE